MLLGHGRIVPVDRKELRRFRGTVYNMEVDEPRCYTVGRNSMLVHNNNGDGTGLGGTAPSDLPARYSGRYGDGQKAYRTNVPRDATNTPSPHPDATGAHTRLQRDAVNPNRVYSGTEFDAAGNPMKRVDFAGRKGDAVPHQHPYDPATKAFGPKESLQ